MNRPPPQRAIPSVEKVLQALGETTLPRPVVVRAVREHLQVLRAGSDAPPVEEIVQTLRGELSRWERGRLQPVINATGILVHTNLGRSPLSAAAAEAVAGVAAGYSNLELDLESGERGGRAVYLEHCLALLCEAEAATVVNNCAAALVLILRHLTSPGRNEIIISRGELVQIGGGFRIPEILETSGAKLREVGTTNRTTVDDYAGAINPDTALILRVHRSNFYMDGFVESPAVDELAALVRRHKSTVPGGLRLVEDLGSGAMVDVGSFSPVAHEPQPQESLRAGVDLVCFSGDKLLGGPQAGIIAGRGDLVASLKRNALFRALRCDKMVFAALQATIEAYLRAAARRDSGAAIELPVLAMLQLTEEELRTRAASIAARLSGLPIAAAPGEATAEVGGGVCPRSNLPSVTVDLVPRGLSLETLATRLRHGSPPVIGYLASGRLRLDVRTVFPSQDEVLVAAIRAALSAPGSDEAREEEAKVE